jgi:xylulokinase
MDVLLLGLDLGTSGAKAAVYDPSGRLQAESVIDYPTLFPAPGRAEQRPLDWKQALTVAVWNVVDALGRRVSDLAGAALAAQGPGLVLIGERGELLVDTIPTWQDERCAAEGRWLYDRVNAVSPGLGGPFTNFLARLRWAQLHQPDAAERARYALGPKDYLLHWLTGEVVTEPTSAAGGEAWDETVLAACGWPVGRLAKILGPTTVAGSLRADVARELGLPRRLPVVMGLNDGASATLATGALDVGEVIVTLATNGVLRVIMEAQVSAATRIDHDLFNWPYLPPERWIAGGQIKAGARTVQWFSEMTGGRDAVAADDLVREAERSEAGSRGAIFLPYLMGRGSPLTDPAATGAFVGMTLASTRGDLVRAVLEGCAFALRDVQDDFADFGHRPRALRLSGGGGRSGLWRQIIADVLGQPLTYHASDSTLGAAMVAAVGLGVHGDWRSATRAMVHAAAHHEPLAGNVERYREGYRAFCTARDALFPRGDAG